MYIGETKQDRDGEKRKREIEREGEREGGSTGVYIGERK